MAPHRPSAHRLAPARALVARRRALGLSQAEVARRMGTSQKVISRLEAGVVDPRASTLERWAVALDGSLGWTFEPGGPSAVLAGFEDLPGYQILSRGLADLAANRLTQEALAVGVVAPRLRGDGLAVPAAPVGSPKDSLWDLLESEVGADAHARYNAIIGRLLSFAAAYEALRGSRP